jgi:hypothetical protein
VKKYLHVMLLGGMLATLLLATLLAPTTPPNVRAQDDATPDPEISLEDEPFKYDDPARVENGDAEFTINRTEFVNTYPDGFIFLGNAESTGGAIVSVSILYSHTPIWEDDTRIRGDINPETGEMRVNVTGPDAWGIPPWLPVNYRWRISDESGAVYFSEWIVGETYADTTRRWTRFENADAIIYMQEGLPDNIAETILENAEATHDAFVAHFGRELSFVPRVMLFNDRDTFDEWRGPQFDTGGIVVGLANPRWGAIVQFDLFGDPIGLANTVVHEIAHLYQYDIFESRAPNWWIEGQATYFEFAPDYNYESRVTTNARQNNLPQLFNDAGEAVGVAPQTTDALQIRWHYDVGYTFVEYLVDNYGNDALVKLHALLATPDDLAFFEVGEFFAASLEAATGVDVATLERNWRASLGAPAERPTLVPTPTMSMMFPPTPTPFGQ